jgi:hypothetical protein
MAVTNTNKCTSSPHSILYSRTWGSENSQAAYACNDTFQAELARERGEAGELEWPKNRLFEIM